MEHPEKQERPSGDIDDLIFGEDRGGSERGPPAHARFMQTR